MTKRQRTWVYRAPRNPKAPEAMQAIIATKATQLVDQVLKPTYIQPPPEKARFNYIVDIYTKWHGAYFYFCAKYCCPSPNALSPFFDVSFTRLRYLGSDAFNLAYMRHTGRWVEVYHSVTLDECMSAIRDDPLFHP